MVSLWTHRVKRAKKRIKALYHKEKNLSILKKKKRNDPVILRRQAIDKLTKPWIGNLLVETRCLSVLSVHCVHVLNLIRPQSYKK